MPIDRNFKIWELIDKFEEWVSKEKEWKVIRFYDLIHVKNEYYKFIWTQDFHLETFKKILSRQSCSIGDYRSYKTVEVSYLIWILNEIPRPMVWNLVKRTPCLSRRVAIYAVTEAFSGIFNCLKLNETHTIVLEEFENFLKTIFGIKLKNYFEKNTDIPAKFVCVT